MTTLILIRNNSIKGLILFCLFTIMILNSCMVNAQSSREILDRIIYNKVNTWNDSVRKLSPRKFPRYFGGELSISVPQYILKSDVAALAGMHVSFIGTNLGGVMATTIAKLKANAGMYYSNPSVPCNIGMLQGSISASVYFLRLRKVTYHNFEPYASVGFTYQRNSYYGYYLPTSENGAVVQTNYSSTEQPLLGRTGFTMMNVGAGIEYQLQSENNLFIHLFAEVNYGFLVASNASIQAFKGTTPNNQSSISFGINLGILK